MRLLWLTNGFPYPLTSGYLRHYFLLKELSRDHEITLLSIVGPGFRPEHVEALEPFTEHVQTFPSGTKGRSLVHKLARRLGVAEPAVVAMRDAIARLSRERSYDAVFCGKWTLPAIAPLHGVPVIADMCDATSSRMRRDLRVAKGWRKAAMALDWARTRSVESRLMRVAAHSVFITCRDREAILGDGPAPDTTIMPNGVDVDFWHRGAPQRGTDTIAFTGAMDYRPNADAALHLAENVLPLVRREVPAAKLLIVGRDPTPRLQRAGEADGVEVTGFVDDVRPYLERATVFAAPLRIGAGIQNKVLEAMAMEVPVVASTLAADGLRTEEGDRPPADIADDPESMAERIVAHLKTARVDATPHREGRRFVERHYVWRQSAAKLDRVLRAATPLVEEPCSP